jgi:hypothetical protein
LSLAQILICSRLAMAGWHTTSTWYTSACGPLPRYYLPSSSELLVLTIEQVLLRMKRQLCFVQIVDQFSCNVLRLLW